MKKNTYTHNDAESIKKELPKISGETIDLLCKWLEENGQTLVIEECYDSQSGWYGKDVMIGRANLAINGYCLSEGSILKFISGGKDVGWYRFYDPEYIEIMKEREAKG